MKRYYLVDSCCLLSCLLITACDFSGNEPPPVVDTNTSTSTTTIPEIPAKTIDLTLSPAILEAMQQPEKDFLAPAETLPAPVINSSKENAVRFSGKLHLDKSDDKEYLDAIDGGEINVELKFE